MDQIKILSIILGISLRLKEHIVNALNKRLQAVLSFK